MFRKRIRKFGAKLYYYISIKTDISNYDVPNKVYTIDAAILF